MIRTLIGAVVVFVLTTAAAIMSQTAPAAAAVLLSDMQAQMTMSRNSGGDRVMSLIVNSSLFGAGGFALGQFEYPPDPFYPPEPVRWFSQTANGAAIADGTVAISFTFNSAGEVSGIQPTPFLFMQSIGGPLADLGSLLQLDFSGADGSLGSLNLSGVTLLVLDGSRAGDVVDVSPFTITAIPLPPAAWLFLTGLSLVVFVGWRRRIAA